MLRRVSREWICNPRSEDEEFSLDNIILVYNVHKYCQVFLSSVVAQTLENANDKRLLRKMLSYFRLDFKGTG